MAEKERVLAYTDGACRGNPGPGGWGVILKYQEVEKILLGAEAFTTNNRMELMAAIQALNALNRPCKVSLYTDSEYVKRGITEWMKQWKKNNWRNSSKKTIKNIDLWQALEEAQARHQVDWHWVRGHSGHLENERVDKIANRAIDEYLLEEKE